MARLPSLLLQLSPPGRKLLLRAFLLVGVIRALLWVLPFSAVRRVAGWLGQRSPRARPLTPAQVENRAWAVREASRAIPGATCLTQALATQALLGRAGQASQLRIGVARAAGGSIRAHAWLEVDGRVVVGDEELERYTALHFADSHA